MSLFVLILILLWIAISAVVILFVVVMSSRLGRHELDINYKEVYEERRDETATVGVHEPCTIL